MNRSSEKCVVVELPAQWALLNHVRKVVFEHLQGYNAETREAVAMVASELVENAIKYGEPLPDGQNSQFCLSMTGGLVRIEVTNGLSSATAFRALLARLEEIAAADDKMALYVRRMQEIYDNPVNSVGLGLFRIAFEGACTMQCFWSDRVLRMVATRLLGDQHHE